MRAILPWMMLMLTCSCLDAVAAVNRVEPFSGALQESWESFDSYRSQENPVSDVFLNDPTPIFVGMALISHPKVGIFEVNSGAGYNLGSSGLALPADGFKGAGLGSTGPQVLPRYVETASITFAAPLTAFGGYWGAATDYLYDPEIIEFQFFDIAGNLVGSDEKPFTRSFLIDESKAIYFGDGQLEWTGWQFDEPVQRIVFGGGFIVADFLQANPIPEPSSLTLISIAALGVFGTLHRPPIRS